MPLVSTQIQINASPAKVRSKFMDFDSLSKYHTGWIKSISPKVPGEELREGSQVHVVLQGGTFDATCLENSPEVFAWRGSIPLLFTGDHSFRFIEAGESTLFVQEENFSGPLGFLMGENYIAKLLGFHEKTKNGFSTLNEDLKKVCEEQ